MRTIVTDLETKEESFRDQLDGRRLVCEIDFDEELIGKLQEGLQSLHLGAWKAFPHVAAVTTVGVGVYRYKSGSYWDHWSWLEKPNETVQWGKRFEKFLNDHSTLETFRFLVDSEGAHRFVAPILAHGGVPNSCLDELFEIITRYGSTGESGDELLEYLQGQISSLTIHSVPLERFIKYGGEVAEDLVGRLVAMRDARDGNDEATFGLPQHISRRFHRWLQEHTSVAASSRARFPTPVVRLDPRALRLDLRLPPCGDHPDAGRSWHVQDHSYSSDRMTLIPLREPWSALEVVNGNRRFVFRGLSEECQALFFDPRTGHLIREPEKRRLPERVWAIVPDGIEISATPDDNEPFEPWKGYNIVSLDLEGADALRVGSRIFEVRRPFFTGELQPLPWVHSAGKLPVLAHAPALGWPGEANVVVERDSKPRGEISISASDFRELLTDPGEYNLVLRGPLGQRFRLPSFVLIPGLQVEVEPAIRFANSQSVRYDVSLPNSQVPPGAGSMLSLTSTDVELPLEVEVPGRRFSLVLSVPRLEWLFSSTENVDGEAEQWNATELSVPISELDESLFPQLVVRLPLVAATQDLEIFLENANGSRLESRSIRVLDDRIWRFDLRQARGWCVASGRVETVDLVVRDSGRVLHKGRALEIRPEWDLVQEDFNVSWKKDESEHVVTWRWIERGPVSSGRWLVLEPCWRPWEEPTLQRQLQPHERHDYEFRVRLNGLRPGKYRARAIHAPWGLNDPSASEACAEAAVDVYKEVWPQIFSLDAPPGDHRHYLEALVAHWAKPELVRRGPPAPVGMTGDQVVAFLKDLEAVKRRCGDPLPPGWNDSLGIFWKNLSATLEIVSTIDRSSHRIWDMVLPHPLVLSLSSITRSEQELLKNIVLNHRSLRPATHWTARQSQDVMKTWRKMLSRNQVPARLGDVLFVCERFEVVDARAASGTKTEYATLKKEHEQRV